MNTVNTNTLLGKKVGYWTGRDFPQELNIEPVYNTGIVIATFNVLENYKDVVGNDVLFLRDGDTEPDYVSLDRDFDVLN